MVDNVSKEFVEFGIISNTAGAEDNLRKLMQMLNSLQLEYMKTTAKATQLNTLPAGANASYKKMTNEVSSVVGELKKMLAVSQELNGTFDVDKFNKATMKAFPDLAKMITAIEDMNAGVVKHKNILNDVSTIDLKRINYAKRFNDISDKQLRTLAIKRDSTLKDIEALKTVQNSQDNINKLAAKKLDLVKVDADIAYKKNELTSKNLELDKKSYVNTVKEGAAAKAKNHYLSIDNKQLTDKVGVLKAVADSELEALKYIRAYNVEGKLYKEYQAQSLKYKQAFKAYEIEQLKNTVNINSEGKVTEAQRNAAVKAQAKLDEYKLRELSYASQSTVLSTSRVKKLEAEAKVLQDILQNQLKINKNNALDAEIANTRQKIQANFNNLTKARIQEEDRLNKKRENALKLQKREDEYNSLMSVHSAKRAFGYTLLFAAIGAVGTAFGAMIQNVLDADLQMRTLGAVLDLNITQAKHLSTSIRDLGNTYGGSLTEIEGVALALGRAGIATKDMIPATEIVLRMARLTGDTFEQSASAIISFQQVFGNTTAIETLGNKLAYIANVSRLSTQDIGTFSNYALAAAKAVGMTEDAVGGLAAAFSNAGVNASTIGTEIRTFTGILTSSSEDVQDFFLGIGINQKQFASEVAKGGAASNKAILDFVDTLSKMDKAKFNTLTGNMDKLTTNVLALMKNNKDNIAKFTQDLEAGAPGQLKTVDIILEAHRVSIEKTWNRILNVSQKGITALEEMASDSALWIEKASLEGSINSKGSALFDLSPDKAIMQKRLDEVNTVIAIRKNDIALAGIQAKIDKASGEELNKLISEKLALMITDQKLKDTLNGKASSASAKTIEEQEAQLNQWKAIIEAELKKSGIDKSTHDLLMKQLKEQEDQFKKLKKEAETPLLKVEGLDYDSLGKDLKSKLST